MRTFSLIILFLISSVAYAETYRGATLLAAYHKQFPKRQGLLLLPTTKAGVQVLWGTFGVPTPGNSFVDQFTARYRNHPHLLSIAFSNEACRRNHRCKSGELYPRLSVREYNRLLEGMRVGTKQRLQARVLAILDHVRTASNSQTRIILTTGLEDNYSVKAYEKLYSVIKEVWPYEIVRNPLVPDYWGSAPFIELHAVSAPCYKDTIKSLDGTAIGTGSGYHPSISWDEANRWVAKGRQCFGVFLWKPEWQGILQRKFIEPRRRTFIISNSDIRRVRSVWK